MDDAELTAAGHMAEDVFVRQMRRLRVDQGLSQAELANRIGDLGGSLYQQTIAKIESGQRAVRLQEADLIATALRSSVSEMLVAEIEESPEKHPADPETMDIVSLVEKVHEAQRRKDRAQSELHAMRFEEARAREELQVAETRALSATRAAAQKAAEAAEADGILKYLTRISLSRQSELNREYGPRWREKLSIRPPITLEMLTQVNEEKPDPEPGAEEGS